MIKYLWLAVTADKYELPMFIEDTAKNLAKTLKVTKNSIVLLEFVQRTKGSSGKNVGFRVFKVEDVI